MRKKWDAHRMEHAPVVELHNGAFVPHAEHPGRAESILAAIGGTEPARDHGAAPILRVHRRDYVDFVKRTHADWKGPGRPRHTDRYPWPVVRPPALSPGPSGTVAGRVKEANKRLDQEVG